VEFGAFGMSRKERSRNNSKRHCCC